MWDNVNKVIIMLPEKTLALAFQILAALVSVKFVPDGIKDLVTTNTCFNCVSLSNGQWIPVVGFGTWKIQGPDATKAVTEAIESGYRHIDTADIYGNEKEIGIALRDLFSRGIVKREELFITTKVWNTQHSEELALKSVHRSLDKLGLSYLDLVLVHWPHSFQSGGADKPKDANGTIIGADLDKENFEFAYRGLEKAIKLGLVKSIGVSNFNVGQLERIFMIAKVPPVINQVESHPLLAQNQLLDYCTRNGIRLEAYSPLRRAQPDLLDNETMKRIGQRHGKTVAQVALRWQIQRGVEVIPKSTKVKRMRENRDVFNFALSSEEMKQIAGLDRNDRVINATDAAHLEEYPFK